MKRCLSILLRWFFEVNCGWKFDLNKDEKIKEINIAINKNIIFITLLIENDEKEIYFRIINKKMDEINSTFKMFLKKILINEIKLKN